MKYLLFISIILTLALKPNEVIIIEKRQFLSDYTRMKYDTIKPDTVQYDYKFIFKREVK